MTYLLLWVVCATGSAKHVIPLPTLAICNAVAATLTGDSWHDTTLATECRNPEWASIDAPTDAPCGYGGH